MNSKDPNAPELCPGSKCIGTCTNYMACTTEPYKPTIFNKAKKKFKEVKDNIKKAANKVDKEIKIVGKKLDKAAVTMKNDFEKLKKKMFDNLEKNI